MSSRTIKICFEGEKKNIIVQNDMLKKSTLMDNFPAGGKLTYKINDEIYIPQTDEENIILDANVNTYDLNVEIGKNE